MSAGIGSVASAVCNSVGVKTAVQPGDAFYTPDPAVPYTVNITYNKVATWLQPGGFQPASTTPWTVGQYFTYMGYHYAWVGTHWVAGDGYQETIGRGQNQTGNFGGLFVPKTARANRLTAVNTFFKANPLTAWPTGTWHWLWLPQWNGTSWAIEGHPPTNTNPKALWPGMFLSDPAILYGDSGNAARISTLGYVPALTEPWYMSTSLPWGNEGNAYCVTFLVDSQYQTTRFYWTGSAWATVNTNNIPQPPAGYTPGPGSTTANAYVSSLADDEKCIGAIMCGYTGGGSYYAGWLAGQSCTIGGKVMHWRPGSATNQKCCWHPGVAP